MSLVVQFELHRREDGRWVSTGTGFGGMAEMHGDAIGTTAAKAFDGSVEKVREIIKRDVDGEPIVFNRDRSRSTLITLKSILGHIAMWAVRQSPYTMPDGLAEVLQKFEEIATQFFQEGIAVLPMRTFTERQLEAFLVEYLMPIEQVQKWNERKNGNKAPIGCGSTDPDDDFIDLYAMVSNIAKSTWLENWGVDLRSSNPEGDG